MTPRTRKSLLRLLILVLALTLILSSAVYAAPSRAGVAPINAPAVSAFAPGQTCNDKFEPNESYNGAVQFPVQTDQYAYICTSTDEDWFKFSVVAGQRIEVNLTQLPADYDLELYSPSDSSTPVQVSDGTGDERIVYYALESGDYRVRAFGYNGAYDASDPYVITIVLFSTTCNDPYEDDNTFATAYGLTPPDNINAYICTADDNDWFKFNVTAGQSINLWLSHLPADYDLYLYDPDGSKVAESRASGTADENITYASTVSGWYRARIAGYNGAYDRLAYYTLQVTLEDPPTPTPTATATPTCPDTYEPNDVPAQAVDVASGIAFDAYICSASDVDWFKISVNDGQIITVDLTSLPADYDVYLYEPSDTTYFVASSTNSGTSNEQIVHGATVNGEYGVKVVGDYGAYSRTDPYTLKVTLTTPTATPTVTPTPEPTATPTATPVTPTATPVTPTATPVTPTVTPTPDNCGDFYEPNDNFAQAKTIPVGVDVQAYMCPSGDEDWFKFSVTAGQRIIIDLAEQGTTISLYKPNGAWAEDGSIYPPNSGEQIVYDATVSGEYRVSVSEVFFANAVQNPTTDSYTLRVTLQAPATATPTRTPTPRPTSTPTPRPTATPEPTQTPGPTATPVICNDPYEPNEILSAAKAIPVNTAIHAYICANTDYDWFKFDVTFGQIITVDLTNLPTDYDLYLYDSSDQQIGTSEKSAQLPEQIIRIATRSGSYKVLVNGYGSAHDAVHPYTLRAKLEDPHRIYAPMILKAR